MDDGPWFRCADSVAETMRDLKNMEQDLRMLEEAVVAGRTEIGRDKWASRSYLGEARRAVTRAHTLLSELQESRLK